MPTPILNSFPFFSAETGAFRLVYEQKSIHGAARRGRRDPSQLSRTVARLESSLRVKLFIRHKTGLHPTSAADQFYRAIIRAERSFDHSVSGAEGESRQVRIGFSSSVGYSHFGSEFLLGLEEERLNPVFRLAPSIELIESIKKRELDLILVPAAVKFPGLIAKKVGRDGLVLCSSSGVEQKTLLVNSTTIGLTSALEQIRYDSRWTIDDYFVLSRMLAEKPNTMGVLPESLCSAQTGLKMIRRFRGQVPILALSWPGSPALTLLKHIRRL